MLCILWLWVVGCCVWVGGALLYDVCVHCVCCHFLAHFSVLADSPLTTHPPHFALSCSLPRVHTFTVAAPSKIDRATVRAAASVRFFRRKRGPWSEVARANCARLRGRSLPCSNLRLPVVCCGTSKIVRAAQEPTPTDLPWRGN